MALVDFRSRGERDRADQQVAAEQDDYKRMFQQVLAENEAYRAKLDEITTSHGELQAQFGDLLGQFQTLKASSQERSDDLLKMAANMETMVSTAYEQQGDLMDRFRADIAQRLSGAKASLPGLEDLS